MSIPCKSYASTLAFTISGVVLVLPCRIATGADLPTWKHLSSTRGELPAAAVGRQAAAWTADLDKDGINDFLIAGWGDPSMVWFRRTGAGWKRYLLDDRKSHIEAGGAVWDIDGDGDLDILQKCFQHEKRIDIWLNNGTTPRPERLGRWQRRRTELFRPGRVVFFTAADLSGDARMDIVAVRGSHR